MIREAPTPASAIVSPHPPRPMRLAACHAAPALLLLALSPLAACSDDPDPTGGEPALAPFSLAFEAILGGSPFACGVDVPGVGAQGTTVTTTDLRLYVHDLTLLGADGAEAPMRLDDVAPHQGQQVALLDFAAPGPGCPNAAPGTRTVVEGQALAGFAATGVRFTLGVPFALNHQDASVASPPLAGTSMFWNWQGGYKFVRFDLQTAEGTPWFLHLGSTGCTGPQTAIEGCARENRPVIEVRDWTPGTPLRIDLDALLAASDLSFNTPETAPGCMSSPMDPDCDGIFAALGLTEPALGQTVFAAAR